MAGKASPRAAGIAIFAGASQFLLSMLVAESMYPGYSVSRNYISDLGVGPVAFIFNPSIIVLGLLLIAAAVLIRGRSLAPLLLLAGIGAMGVGIFPENSPVLHAHLIASLVTFLFASISSYPAALLSRGWGRYVWPVLGTISLIALILYAGGTYAGLGVGGMERMIVYPDLAWSMGFSGELMSRQ